MRKRLYVYKHRHVFFALSAVILLTGLIVALIAGIKIDIEFQGGSILKYSFAGTVDMQQAETLIQEALGKPVSCQIETDLSGAEQKLTVNLAGNAAISSQEQSVVTDTLINAFPDAGLKLSEALTVEPYYGSRFFRQGITAIVVAFLLILVYVGFRFRRIGGISAGTMAIIALVHDALVVLTVFIVFRIPLNEQFIAAVLTIIGFSINDTIVIYDRIRENKSRMGGNTKPEDLVDVSITESMTRSINTNLVVFISITIAFIFSEFYGIASIRQFALPMMFGTVAGCYSTNCIAGPLWSMWRNRKIRLGERKA
jgi:preprotein translocase subunit SecF